MNKDSTDTEFFSVALTLSVFLESLTGTIVATESPMKTWIMTCFFCLFMGLPVAQGAFRCQSVFESTAWAQSLPPMAIPGRVNQLGGCYRCVAEILDVLRFGSRSSYEIDSFMTHMGLPEIRSNAVSLSNARVVYLLKNGDRPTSYFHTILFVNGRVFDPYDISPSHIYTPRSLKNWRNEHQANYRWAMDIPASSFNIDAHMQYLHRLRQSFFSKDDIDLRDYPAFQKFFREIEDLDVASSIRAVPFENWLDQQPTNILEP